MSTPELIPLTVSVQHPAAATLTRGAAAALSLVESFEITDAATYEIGADELKAIKGRAATLEEQRKAITKPMDDAKKAVMDLFRGPIDTLTQAETILKRKMLAYSTEQQRIADEQRRQAEAQAKAERERLAAEARAAEEAAAAARVAQQQAAQAMQDTQDEAERQRLAAEAAAQAAEVARLSSEAQITQQTAAMVVAAPVAVEPVKVSGVAVKKSVSFEIVDTLALIQHVAAHPELLSLVRADEVKLRAYVRGLGLSCALPGVRVFEEQSLSASRRG